MCPTIASRRTPSADAPLRIDVARIRREQILKAAVDIIVEQGLQNLSLSRIEQRTGMKRGQLTYYFKTWEAILLAVFDRLLLLMCQKMHETSGDPLPPPDEKFGVAPVWEGVQKLLQMVLGPVPLGVPFHALQYTFLAQISHRVDFRQRIASLYEEWRSGLAAHWFVSAKPALAVAGRVAPRTVASFVQAVVHGLSMQLAADPEAFDRTEMLQLCIGVFAPLFASPEAEGSAKPATSPRPGRPRRTKELSHD